MSIEPEAYPDIDANTRLMNIHHLSDMSQADVYIGPADESMPVMRELPSTVIVDFQNPFAVSRYGRFGAVENYKAYFYKNYLLNDSFRDRVHKLEGKTICDTSYPKRSHGYVIVRFLHKRKANNMSPQEVVRYIQRKLENMDSDVLSPEGHEHREDALEKIYSLELQTTNARYM